MPVTDIKQPFGNSYPIYEMDSYHEEPIDELIKWLEGEKAKGKTVVELEYTNCTGDIDGIELTTKYQSR